MNKRILTIQLLSITIFIVGIIATLIITYPSQQEIIKKNIQEKMNTLIELSNNEAIHNEIDNANKKNMSMSYEKILESDAQWRNKQSQTLIETISKNPASQELIAFQKTHPEFVEIFITDSYGLNVAMTNETSDYYQADESWWRETHNEEIGYDHADAIIYDDSARTWGIPLYFTIKNNDNKVIGIVKSIISINSLRADED